MVDLDEYQSVRSSTNVEPIELTMTFVVVAQASNDAHTLGEEQQTPQELIFLFQQVP